MEPLDGIEDIVHPEVRAHITSLVSAVGGPSAEDGDDQYQLGDDALQVLRDLKRWIRFYDEKTNRMDVARCIWEANLVSGDLLPILAHWRGDAAESKLPSRIALACLELLVPLTWPFEPDKDQMTVNHHRHMPVLELAQLQYKKDIINYDRDRLLHTAVRLALPSMAIPNSERSERERAIIKLVLFFLRNVAYISRPPKEAQKTEESQTSRSAVIDAFSYQDVLPFLLTLASNMGTEFGDEDTIVMEAIHHLVKGVDIEKLFMNAQQLNKAAAGELSSLMSKEAAMLSAYNRKGPTRHNRFGTMIWVKRDGGKMSALSGQAALADAAIRCEKLDSGKTFKPPRRGRKPVVGAQDLIESVKLDLRAHAQLRSFVEDFLDSGFNPLFQHIRKSIDRERGHVLHYHKRQFFRLVAWFLEAERVRRKTSKQSGRRGASDDVGSFNLIAGVLDQEMFVALSRALHESHQNKEWSELAAVMRCFTQILLTVQEMAASGNDEDEEIAENVLSRLFYEESTHEVIAQVARSYKDQGLDYLDAATELVHHYLRILEAYSKQNVDMQIRSRRRTRQKKTKKKKEEAAAAAAAADANIEPDVDHESDESMDDDARAAMTIKERKFDFSKCANRFMPQGVVDTFATWTKHYKDLSDAQLKRAHRYFYRLAFKQHMGVMLFRVDIIHLLYKMIKGPEALDKTSPMFKEWEELVRHILRKMFKKIEERPELIVEMLFSKVQATANFLEFGHDVQTVASKREAKPGAELVFRHTEERDRQVAIVVGAMLDRNEGDHIAWVKRVLSQAENERRSWAAAQVATAGDAERTADVEGEAPKPPIFYARPDDDSRRKAIFRNSRLRLLLNVCGLARLGPASEETMESPWVVPNSVEADHLKDSLHYINQAEFSPPTFDDGASAEKQLKRKTVPRKKAAFDDDDDNGDGAADEGLDDETLFPAGGPTTRKAIDGDAKPKKRMIQRRRRRGDANDDDDDDGDEDGPDEAVLAERARKRRERELDKARRIKSALYVREGDDEFDSDEDAAFFERERAIAERARKAALSADAAPLLEKVKKKKKKKKKRKSRALLSDGDGDDDDDDGDDGGGGVNGDEDSRRRSLGEDSEGEDAQSARATDDDDNDDDDHHNHNGDNWTGDEDGVRQKRKRLRKSLAHSTPSSPIPDDAAQPDVQDVDMQDAPSLVPLPGSHDAEDKEEDGEGEAVRVARRPRVRGGFVVDSDDE